MLALSQPLVEMDALIPDFPRPPLGMTEVKALMPEFPRPPLAAYNGHLGIPAEELQIIGARLAQDSVSFIDLRNGLAPFSDDERQAIASAYLAAGGDPNFLAHASEELNRKSGRGVAGVIVAAISTASMAASTYHGYKRNDSIGWALWWGLMGSLFPVITPVIAVAQGFGDPK